MYRKGLGYDWAEVHREVTLARKLNPGVALVKERAAIIDLLPHGLMEEAVAELKTHSSWTSGSKHTKVARDVSLAGRPQRSSDRGGANLAGIGPAGFLSHFVAGLCYGKNGRSGKRLPLIAGGGAFRWRAADAGVARPGARQSGETAEAREILDRLLLMAATGMCRRPASP